MPQEVIRGGVRGKHFVSDLTLPHGRVLFDYIKDAAG